MKSDASIVQVLMRKLILQVLLMPSMNDNS